MKKLTIKQEKFIFEFIRTGNATQAYLTAYGTTNKASAGVFGHRLLKNDKIQAEIINLREEMRQQYQFELSDYIKKLLEIVGADIGDYVKFGRRKNKNYVELAESETVDTSVISEIRQVKGDVTVKLLDKNFALKELARIFGFGENGTDSELPTVLVDNVSNADES